VKEKYPPFTKRKLVKILESIHAHDPKGSEFEMTTGKLGAIDYLVHFRKYIHELTGSKYNEKAYRAELENKLTEGPYRITEKGLEILH